MIELPSLPVRTEHSHKGSYGHALLVGGSTGMTGAIAIAGMSCLRSGAGLVTLAVPESSLNVVASFDPCYMTSPLPCDSVGRLTSDALLVLQTLVKKANCLAIGPGLGRSSSSDQIVMSLVEHANLPVVLDADGLNSLSESEFWMSLSQSNSASGFHENDCPRILTPHPGEWERLSGISSKDRAAQIESAKEWAARTHSVIVLKGHRTWITDGVRSHENQSGNPSLAVGGSGDCLTGIIAALICQGMSCFEAAVLGVHLHGLAGDLAHQELGSPSTLPLDLIRFLPNAFRTAHRKSIGFN